MCAGPGDTHVFFLMYFCTYFSLKKENNLFILHTNSSFYSLPSSPFLHLTHLPPLTHTHPLLREARAHCLGEGQGPPYYT